MIQSNTHLAINTQLSGEITKLGPNHATVELTTTNAMIADAMGLVHGGFIFSAADYAAMAAVNEPNVVLAKANVKFTAPVKLAEHVILQATVIEDNNQRQQIEVIGTVGERMVFKGDFFTAVLDKHVLSM